MASGDLTTVPAVKDWLNTSGKSYPPGSEVLLQRLVTSASRFAESYMSINVDPVDVTETYSSVGTGRIFLRSSPVLSITSLTVNGVSMSASPGYGQSGYTFDDRCVYGVFPAGTLNVTITYVVGFQTQEAAVIPAAGPLPVSTLSRLWNTDRGITGYVAVKTAPAAGQYQVKAQEDFSMAYLFNAADAGKAISVRYGYTPDDIAQAVTELVGEKYKVRSRIGERSQAVGQQTVSFVVADMSESVKTALRQNANVSPAS